MLRIAISILLCFPAFAEEVRIMAANTSSGNQQSYDLGHGARIFQGLKPDIVLIQEFNVGSNTDQQLRDFVTENLGAEFSYVEEGKSSGQIQNGIISRYPILDSGIWDDDDMTNREFVWAQIDVPGEKDLWAVSVHFKASSGSSARRRAQAAQLIGYVQANVPEEDFLVIGGDFNTQNRSESCLRELSAEVVVTGPYPSDRNGTEGTNASRAKPYDWVMVEQDLSDLEIPVTLGNRDYDHGIVFDSRVFTPLSAVAPVLSGDSSAPQMQHMAVMRSFELSDPISPYEEWAQNVISSEDQGALADPDGDGYVNLIEFATGSNPNVPDSIPLLSATPDGDEMLWQFPVRMKNGEEALSYELIYWQTDGSQEVQFLSTEDSAALGDFVQRTVRSTRTDKAFFQLRVSLRD